MLGWLDGARLGTTKSIDDEDLIGLLDGANVEPDNESTLLVTSSLEATDGVEDEGGSSLGLRSADGSEEDTSLSLSLGITVDDSDGDWLGWPDGSDDGITLGISLGESP